MKVILHIASNLADEHGVIKLASVSSSSPSPASPSGKTGYCYKFQNNNCSKGESCQYRHVIDPNFQSRRPPAPQNKAKPPVKGSPKTGTTPKLPFKANLTTAHQAIVGAPAGIVTALSPQGYSIRQQHLIKALTAVPVSSTISSVTVVNDPESSDPAPDYTPWQYPTINGFQASDVDQSLSLHHTLKYLKFSYSEVEHLQTKRTSDNTADHVKDYAPGKYARLTDLKILSPFLLHNFVNDFAPSTFMSRNLGMVLHHIEQYYSVQSRTGLTYSRADPNISLEPINWLAMDSCNGRATVEVSLLFQWNLWPLLMIREMHQRVDVVKVNRDWMHLIAHTAQLLLFGILNDLSPQSTTDDYEYTTFNTSVHHPYRKSTSFGHYWSQMTSIHDYVILHQHLQNLTLSTAYANNTLHIDTAIHAIIYDFMAFASQYLGYFRNTNYNLVEFIRDALIDDLHKVTCPLFHNNGLFRMFKAILLFSGPCRDDVRRCIPTTITKAIEKDIFPEFQLINHPPPSFGSDS